MVDAVFRNNILSVCMFLAYRLILIVNELRRQCTTTITIITVMMLTIIILLTINTIYY